MRKKITRLMLIAVVSCFLCGFQTFRGETGISNANLTTAKTPINTEKGGSIWTRSFVEKGKILYNSDPVLWEDYIFIANKNTLYQLNQQGQVIKECTLTASINTTCHPLEESGRLYIPLSGGAMDCIDLQSMTCVWSQPALEDGTQSLSTLFYHDGYLYAGITRPNGFSNTTGTFYCRDASTGEIVWSYSNANNPGGYYWSGGIVCENTLVFVGDNGELVSHDLTSDTIYDTLSFSSTDKNGDTTPKKFRSGITYDPATASYYVVSTDGTLYRFSMDGKKFDSSNIRTLSLGNNNSYVNCTSTPTICNNRLYVGCGIDGTGYLCVIDVVNMKTIYRAKGEKGAEIKASPLVSTGYSSAENANTVYVYVTYNKTPGGIYVLKDTATSQSGTLDKLFTPASRPQYCMSSIIAGTDGTLYYTNDSGTLFAIREVEKSSDLTDEEDNSENGTNSGSNSNNTSASTSGTSQNTSTSSSATAGSQIKTSSTQKNKTVKKPTKVTIKKRKKTYRITWKKTASSYSTQIWIKRGNGKWKTISAGKKKSYVLKRGKKPIRIKIRCRKKINGRWQYSKYTKTYKLL